MLLRTMNIGCTTVLGILGLFALLILVGLCAGSASGWRGAEDPAARPEPPIYSGGRYERVRMQGQMHLVVLAPGVDPESGVIDEVIAEFCPGTQRCRLLVWADPTLVPQAWPMTDPRAKAVVVGYTRNPTTRLTESIRHPFRD